MDLYRPEMIGDTAPTISGDEDHQPIVGDPDLSKISIIASAHNVVETLLCTKIGNEYGCYVGTIEHLMAAFAFTGIDDVIVDINGPEVPILDGSAAPFVNAIQAVGTTALSFERHAYVIHTPFRLDDGDRYVMVEPYGQYELDVEICYTDPAIGRQSVYLSANNTSCQDRMAFARTFCELKSVESLRSQGLCQGGSMGNAIVVDNGKVLNDDHLRDPNEFVLHKALDLVGDLHLAEAPIIGRVKAYKPGHDINNRFLRGLLDAGEDIFDRLSILEDGLAQTG